METDNYVTVKEQTKHRPQPHTLANADRETSVEHSPFGILGKVKA